MRAIVHCICVVVLIALAVILPVQAEEGVIVCLDPGHGGDDPGAVYLLDNGTWLREAEINLDIAFAVKTLLEQRGHQVILTRTDSTTMTTRQRYPIANVAQAAILVSIHTNSIAAEQAPTIDGALTLYYKDQDIPLAQAVESALYSALLANAPVPEIYLDRGVRAFWSRVMRSAEMPAIMVEPVFMSHPKEAALLAIPIRRDASGNVLSNTRRGEIAVALCKGIIAYLETPRSAGQDVTTATP